MSKNVIFSGVQPSGDLHIGNYIGTIKQWVELQESLNGTRPRTELIFCIVDLHAITVPQNPAVLREKIRELAALYIAVGIDPEKSHLFVQSENLDHAVLAWIFDCITPMGWMARMTQYKDKNEKQQASGTVGLFNYPALMAADILLYDTTHVPVGEDQIQHVELARDIAKKFNNAYRKLFAIPKPMIDKQAARIMSLSNPKAKMSKSDVDPNGTINLLDNADDIKKKITRAVTDSGDGISYSPSDKPAISNLMTIYSRLSGQSVEDIEKKYTGKGYADFKTDLAEVVITALKPIQDRYTKLRREEVYLNKILDDGITFAHRKSSKKLSDVKQAIGLGRKI